MLGMKRNGAKPTTGIVIKGLMGSHQRSPAGKMGRHGAGARPRCPGHFSPFWQGQDGAGLTDAKQFQPSRAWLCLGAGVASVKL